MRSHVPLIAALQPHTDGLLLRGRSRRLRQNCVPRTATSHARLISEGYASRENCTRRRHRDSERPAGLGCSSLSRGACARRGRMAAKRLATLLAVPLGAAAASLGRRHALQAYGVTGVTSLAPRPVHAAAAAPKDWESYAVRGDSATMIPSVAAIKADGLVEALATKRAVFLGEHHTPRRTTHCKRR